MLSRASQKAFAIKAEKWSESAHRFLKLCADAGNVEASYTLGMVTTHSLDHSEIILLIRFCFLVLRVMNISINFADSILLFTESSEWSFFDGESGN